MRRLIVLALVVAGCGHHPPPAAPPPPPGNVASSDPAAPSACPPTTPELAAAVARLDTDADPLHGDYTPEVHRLIANGLAGACAVVDKLAAADRDTRLHAERVMEGVLLAEYGWRAGRGYPSQYSEEQSTAIVRAIAYDWDATADAIRAGAERWQRWLDGPHPGVVTPADAPSVADLTTALARIHPQLEQCGLPVDLTVTFDHTGAITSIYGTASTDAAYRTCLATAASAATLKPFGRTDVWIRYPW